MSTLSYNINQNILRADFLYLPSAKHKVEFGIDENIYLLAPGNRKPYGVNSIIVPKSLEKKNASEAALYISDEFDVTDKLLVSGGIRGTLYANLGKHTEFEYADNMPITKISIIDTTYYKKSSISNIYPALDIRVSARYTLASTMSIKMGYQRTSQFIHMVSNNTSISPTDVWTLSNKYIKPQKSDQVSIGFFHTTRDMAIESSVELYYKWMKNSLDYKSGAILLMNEHLETDVIQGIG